VVNRILADAEETRAALAAGLRMDGEPLDTRQLPELEAFLAVDLAEAVVWQTAKSEAELSGLISPDEARTIDAALGGDAGGDPANGGWAAGVDLALKSAVTMCMGEILQRKAAEARRQAWTRAS
jgi:hypothetical protein